ncbi:hypothetical protein JCM10213_009249 [Rhodosporidiobolus nylandii]
MQGPRLHSHHNTSVPDILPPPPTSAKPPPPPRLTASRASSLSSPSRSAIQLAHLDPRPDSHDQGGAEDNPPGGVAAGEGGGDGMRRDLEAAKGDDGDKGRWQRAAKALKRHAAFVGPGVIASVAYLDPGNWSTDLAAGSAYGYSHLFVILFAGLIALLFQILSTRLGCVSDYDLATQCRFALYDRPGKWKLWYRYGLLWPLYLLAEAGIVFTDLAELLGSAIAINLLIPAIPLWAAVLLTSLDVFLILLLFNQYPARTVSNSMRCFELLIGLLVLTVLGAFVALLVEVSPVWKDVFYGYVPRSGIIRGGGIYIAVGIVGATVMPHAFYIGSKVRDAHPLAERRGVANSLLLSSPSTPAQMATMRRLKPSEYGESDDSLASRDIDDFAYEDDKLSPSKPSDPDRRPSDGSNTRGRRRAPPKPYFPSLHLPQPFSLGDVGFDLGTLSRARSRSPAAERSARRGRADEIEEDEFEAREQGEGRKAAMDDVATPPLSSASPLTHSKQRPKPSARSSAPLSSSTTARARPTRPKPTLACIRAHLTHACLDIAGSLLGFAVVVNSCILILGAAVFYYGPYRAGNPDGVSDLFDAYAIVKDYLGQAFAYLFAVALLAAGQSASLTVTLSGQIVSEGFLNWRTKPWKRRLITRIINIVPSLAVAAAVGRAGIDTLLIASQVALSIVLTFVLVPLIIFTSQHSIMAVPIVSSSVPLPPSTVPPASPPHISAKQRFLSLLHDLNPLRRRRAPPEHVTYANPVWVVWLCWMLWLVIGISNVYALYDVSVHGG